MGVAAMAWRYVAAVALTGSRRRMATIAHRVDDETTQLGSSDWRLHVDVKDLQMETRWRGEARQPEKRRRRGASYRRGRRRRSDSVACGPMRSEQHFYSGMCSDRRTPPCSVNQGAAPGDTIAARWAPLISGFQILNKPINLFSMRENRKQMWKNLETFLEIGNPISNTFCYCIFFQISTNFELIKRF
jgi:hypothetical protein